ncbi:MAG: hypothetical protein OJJ21_06675 [Ferrovibrio sp.]|uniref:hypothetical protein n=1 Tax=Ferrovibrio sp. TaxID=1917215 RepID=UPI0026083E7B|nr:hypothetical protein [Ferrovibrio sp.]MCW0233263.1 hypothetical protein [Ferrovibrio sp.]
MLRRILVSSLLPLGIAFTAPPALSQSSFFSGAASMRIDVEVYKGPLSKDIRSQIAEFDGLLNQTRTQFDRFGKQIDIWLLKQGTGCLADMQVSPVPSDILKSAFIRNTDLISAYECALVRQISEETNGLKLDLNRIPSTLQETLNGLDSVSYATSGSGTGQIAAPLMRNVITHATSFAKRISRSAQNWQEIQTAVYLPDPVLRALITSYQFAAAEQANQIASRADALLQQIDGLDRRELPLSAFISGSAPTDFARLFEWNNAYTYPWSSSQKVDDRVQILERLQADMHWARVNTVYASGQGNTAMAFIKDDIGNWSLKQFDNQPGELLDAYSKMAKAAIASATSLITSAATGGSAAGVKSMINLADSIAFGNGGAPDQARAPVDLLPARERIKAKLEDIRLLAEAEEVKRKDDPVKLKELRTETEAQIRQTLAGYQAMLDLLDDATQPVSSTATAAAAPDIPKLPLPGLPGR